MSWKIILFHLNQLVRPYKSFWTIYKRVSREKVTFLLFLGVIFVIFWLKFHQFPLLKLPIAVVMSWKIIPFHLNQLVRTYKSFWTVYKRVCCEKVTFSLFLGSVSLFSLFFGWNFTIFLPSSSWMLWKLNINCSIFIYTPLFSHISHSRTYKWGYHEKKCHFFCLGGGHFEDFCLKIALFLSIYQH